MTATKYRHEFPFSYARRLWLIQNLYYRAYLTYTSKIVSKLPVNFEWLTISSPKRTCSWNLIVSSDPILRVVGTASGAAGYQVLFTTPLRTAAKMSLSIAQEPMDVPEVSCEVSA
jgi:hypothetical protein